MTEIPKNQFNKEWFSRFGNTAEQITTIVLVIVLVLIAFIIYRSVSKDDGPITMTPQEQQDQNKSAEVSIIDPYMTKSDQPLCSRGAQKEVDSINESWLQISNGSNIPATYSFLKSSHYIESLNACFFEANYQLPMPDGTVVDHYTLYVMNGPTEFGVNKLALTSFTVAQCSIGPGLETRCEYFAPTKTQGEDPMWVTQYTYENVPIISYQNYRDLVEKYMTAN